MISQKEIITLKKDLAQKFVIDSLMQKGNITKESLQPFPENFDFVQLIQKFKEILGKTDTKKNSIKNKLNQQKEEKPVDWTMQLAVINYLRRLFKFEKDIFNQAFYGLKFYENIIEFLNSIRSILAQNALTLINEVFSEYIPEEKNQKPHIIGLIKEITPVLILKSNTSQSFIKNEAKICLETLVNNMKYNETLVTLLQLMNTKKIADFESIYILSLKLIKNLGKEFLMNSTQFGEMISLLGDVYANNKSDLYKKRCKSVVNTLTEILSKEEFEKKMAGMGKKEKEKIKEIMEGRVPYNTKKEIHHFTLKSKDKNQNKSCERPKTSCPNNTKAALKKKINIKLVDSKLAQKENSENICNNAISKENKAQIV